MIKRYKCQMCGEIAEEKDLHVFDGKHYCHDCMDDIMIEMAEEAHEIKNLQAQLSQQMSLLERWEEAYNGYAISPNTMKERKEITDKYSAENVGALVGDTRKLLSELKETKESE